MTTSVRIPALQASVRYSIQYEYTTRTDLHIWSVPRRHKNVHIVWPVARTDRPRSGEDHQCWLHLVARFELFQVQDWQLVW
jgi:hypothetical protein